MGVLDQEVSDCPDRVVAELGHGPVAGNPWIVRSYAQTCQGIAATVVDVLPGLQTAASLSAERRSEAVVALCDRAGKVVGSLGKVRDRYQTMGDRLATYAEVLDSVVTQSEGAYSSASSALDVIDSYVRQLRQLRSAAMPIRDYTTLGNMPAEPTDGRGWHQRSQVAYDPSDQEQVAKIERVDELWDVVDGAKVLMDGAWQTLEEAASVVITALRGLHDDGLDDGWKENLSKAGNAMHLDDVRTAVADAGRWVWDHLDDIATLVGVAALVLCWVPVVGQVLAVAAAALSAVVMVKALAEGDMGAAALAAVGVLTFGVGRATTAAIKVTNTTRAAGNVGGKGTGLADDAARTTVTTVSQGGGRASSVWKEALNIGGDIRQEAVVLKAEGLGKVSSWVKPSNLVPEGGHVLYNGMVTSPGVSNSTGLLSSWNLANFGVDSVATVVGAKPYLPGVGDGSAP